MIYIQHLSAGLARLTCSALLHIASLTNTTLSTTGVSTSYTPKESDPIPRMAEADSSTPMPQGELASAQLSQNMDPNDLEAPMNWPIHRKIYVSLAAWLYTFSL